MKQTSIAVILLQLFIIPANAFDFSVVWDDLKKCISGNNNNISNQLNIYIKDLPSNATSIILNLRDKKEPMYMHANTNIKINEVSKMKVDDINFYNYDFVIKTELLKSNCHYHSSVENSFIWNINVKDISNKKIFKSNLEIRIP